MMKSKKAYAGAILSLIAISLFHCATRIAGGASDTEVSAIVGRAVDANEIPVRGALVRLRDQNYYPGSDSGQVRSTTLRIDCITDDNGWYRIDSVTDGNYMIEIISGDTAGSLQPLTIATSVAVECTVSAKLEPFGTIAGAIDVTYDNYFLMNRTKIRVKGTEHVHYPDSSGNFEFSVPGGSHWVKISIDSSHFEDFTFNANVTPSELRYVGTLQLGYKPFIPFPDYRTDSIALRTFLDSAGHPDIPVEQVSTRMHNRINTVTLRGIPVSIPLFLLGELTGLTKVDLGYTGTADSCRFTCGLYSLKSLYLDGNAITGLSRCVEGLPWLEELNVARNRLTSLPEDLARKRFVMLDLSENRFCDFSPYLEGWANYNDPGWMDTQECQ